MAIELDCPNCKLTVKISDALIGKNLRCKKCQEVFLAEDPNSPFEEVADFEVVEDAPRPRRNYPSARQQPDHDEDEYRPRHGARLRRSKLRTIALYQRGLLFCIAANIALYAFLALAADGTRILVLIVFAGVEITGAVFVWLLSTGVYGVPVGVVLTLLAFIPILGLILIAVVNSKATSKLNKHGCDVGFLGASLSQFD